MNGFNSGLALLIAMTLVACDDVGLRTLQKPGDGPDEFAIIPTKPLETPDSFAALPTPGGTNITDQNPLQDGVAALGGNLSVTDRGGADSSVVNHASRLGRDDDIRETLAVEDGKFRKRRARFTRLRLGRPDRYRSVYRTEALDPSSEAERWRRSGALVPSAPPS